MEEEDPLPTLGRFAGLEMSLVENQQPGAEALPCVALSTLIGDISETVAVCPTEASGHFSQIIELADGRVFVLGGSSETAELSAPEALSLFVTPPYQGRRYFAARYPSASDAAEDALVKARE